jgi:hypothetical protein
MPGQYCYYDGDDGPSAACPICGEKISLYLCTIQAYTKLSEMFIFPESFRQTTDTGRCYKCDKWFGVFLVPPQIRELKKRKEPT